MVQDKKNFSSGKKPMAQDLDRKSGISADRPGERPTDTSKSGSMKQPEQKDRSGIAGKRDVGSRK